MSEFATRLEDRIGQFGSLRVGIDPSSAILSKCQLPDTAEGAYEFGKRVLEAAEFRLSIVKPQVAFFERFGSKGWAALEGVTALARSRGVLVLTDGKRGDIDSTATAYGEAFFKPGAPAFTDAVTVHAYLGFKALKGLLDLAVAGKGGVFVVVRSSNPEGQALQLSKGPDGRSVAQHLSADISAFNASVAASGMGPVGAVVGATCTDAEETVRDLPASFILAPGVGAQGATFKDVAVRMPSARRRVLASVSRAVLDGGTDPKGIGATIQKLTLEAREALR
jgi:orotidine-5'-phosphate decarboxylase